MRCLSLIQPWASLIVLGVKRYETRGWHTEYRGLIAIHASRRFPETARALCETGPFRTELLAGGFKQSADLPCGAILGTVELVACRPADEVLARFPSGAAERSFGDFSPGRWAWHLVRPILLAKPVPFTGRLGLFEVPDLESYQRT